MRGAYLFITLALGKKTLNQITKNLRLQNPELTFTANDSIVLPLLLVEQFRELYQSATPEALWVLVKDSCASTLLPDSSTIILLVFCGMDESHIGMNFRMVFVNPKNHFILIFLSTLIKLKITWKQWRK